jgi:hypothetical protein
MGTFSVALRFIDLTADGVFSESSTDGWHLARQMGGLIRERPKLRPHIFGLLTGDLTGLLACTGFRREPRHGRFLASDKV